jgi:putative ABC transport system permease protein
MKLLRRLAALFRKEKIDAEMTEELRAHVELRTQRNLASGMSPDAAHYAALRAFGGVEQIKERCRDERGIAWLDEMLRDLRFAGRMLRKHPGFTLVIVGTLALGIGANTALFSIINSVVLRPLPFADAHRLVFLAERWTDVERASIAYPNFLDWREQQRVFDRMGAYRTRPYNLTGDADPIQISVTEISLDALAVLGVQPTLGRLFLPEEDSPRGVPVALLGDALWRSRYGASPDIVGQTILLDGRAHTVVGVMPPSFDFPGGRTLWVPLSPIAATGGDWATRNAHSGIYSVARLKAGVTLEQARANFDAIAARLDAQYPAANRGHRVLLVSLHDAQVGGAGRALWPLFGAAALVLLIACANVANLLLARASARQSEIAVRAALGASRARILRQLFVEGLLLAALGGAAGLLLAQWMLQGIVTLLAPTLPNAADTRLDGTVLIFFAGLALLSAVLFGLAPAWQASRVDLREALQRMSRGSSARSAKFRHGLVVLELALTLLLLIGAGLLLRTMVQLARVDPGFTNEQVLTFRINLNTGKYPTSVQQTAFFENLLVRLRALPAVKSATVASRVPLDDHGWDSEFLIEGRPEPAPGARPYVELQRIDPDYFRTMGIPLLRGRAFAPREEQSGAGLNAIIIDEEFARRFWPHEDPIGQRVRFPWGGARENNPVVTIVGVVGHVKLEKLSEVGGNVQAYLPFAQMPRPAMTVVLRAAGDPSALLASARQQVLALDPNQPIYSARTFEDLRERSGAPQRLNLILLGSFALMALGLATVGLFGVLSYLVAQRQREIGVRVALGAARSDVVRLIVREGLMLVGIGAAIGVPATIALARVLSNLLFEVSPRDPLTFGAVLTVLVVVALLASWLPARRAAKIDPMLALRAE